jgi:hypothetical protein
MRDRHASRLVICLWMLAVGVAMAAWLAAFGLIAVLLVQRFAT